MSKLTFSHSPTPTHHCPPKPRVWRDCRDKSGQKEWIPFNKPIPDWAEGALPQGLFLALPPWPIEVEFPGFPHALGCTRM